MYVCIKCEGKVSGRVLVYGCWRLLNFGPAIAQSRYRCTLHLCLNYSHPIEFNAFSMAECLECMSICLWSLNIFAIYCMRACFGMSARCFMCV